MRTSTTVYKLALIILALIPLGLYVQRAFSAQLGANPVETLLHASGNWALWLLLLGLALTPARRWLGWSWTLYYRRTIGLLAFLYASLHLLIYLSLELGWEWQELGQALAERPYITLGFSAWLLLVPLAITSTNGMLRRLGRYWKPLHRLVYLCATLALLHFLWLVKADVSEPLLYSGLFLLLMLARWPRRG